jgi:phospholipase C
MFLAFDENDGMFDHVPPPAPPSFNPDGSLTGGSTLKLDGEYFADPERKHLLAGDNASGAVRPWGLGPRVPMYLISPWSKGGWVNSQTFDHTSVGQFLEKRFGVTIPGIGPWHRAVCGDLLSGFDFVSANDSVAPRLPDARGSGKLVEEAGRLPKPMAPAVPEKLFQEPGSRLSRALPYVLRVEASGQNAMLLLSFRNEGTAGAVFHVYDRTHLDRIPRRFTVEAGRSLADRWDVTGDGRYDLWVLGPNGFVRGFEGDIAGAGLNVSLVCHAKACSVELQLTNQNDRPRKLSLASKVYRPFRTKWIEVRANNTASMNWDVSRSGNWYDLTLAGAGPGFSRRFAGRLETGNDGVSDPMMGFG